MIFFEAWLFLMVEATKMIQGKFFVADKGEEDTILMVTEPSDSSVGSPAIFLRGGDQAHVLAHYRRIIAANS